MKKKQQVLLMAAVMAALSVSTGWAAAESVQHVGVEAELNPVVVTANRQQERLANAHADISVVTRKQIEELHLQNVEEALRLVPGVQFLNYGASHVNQNLSGIRINGSREVVVLVDGVRLTAFQANNSGYMNAMLMTGMDNIQRIEVVRGASSVLYGSDAKGGVINIITRNPKKTMTTMNVSLGSGSERAQQLYTQWKDGQVGVKAYLNHQGTGDFEDGDGNVIPNDTTSKSGGLEIQYDFDQNNKLSMSYNKSRSNYTGLDIVIPEGPNNRFIGFYNTNDITITSDNQITDKIHHKLVIRKNTVSSNYHKGDSYDVSSNNYEYTFISDQLSHDVEKNSLIFGYEYAKGVATNSFLPRNKKVYMHPYTTNKSFFIEDTWKPIKQLEFTVGTRYEKPIIALKSGDNRSNSYKVTYLVDDKLSMHYGVSDYYVLPDLEALFSNQYGNAALQPERGKTKTFGITKQFSDSNLLMWNWFNTKEDVGISYERNGKYINTANGIARGWNLQWSSKLGNHVTSNLGWSHLYQKAKNDNLSMGYYPKDKLTFNIMYNENKWDIGFDGFYFIRSEVVNNKNKEFKGWPSDKYGIYNLSFNYKPNKDVKIYLKVNNIFNTLWAEHTDVIHGGGEGKWFAMPGRTFVLGSTYKF